MKRRMWFARLVSARPRPFIASFPSRLLRPGVQMTRCFWLRVREGGALPTPEGRAAATFETLPFVKSRKAFVELHRNLGIIRLLYYMGDGGQIFFGVHVASILCSSFLALSLVSALCFSAMNTLSLRPGDRGAGRSCLANLLSSHPFFAFLSYFHRSGDLFIAVHVASTMCLSQLYFCF